MAIATPLRERLRSCAVMVLCAALLAAAGCGGPAPLNVRAVAPVNLNEQGESLAVRLRLYELKDRAAFLAASFSDLWLDDRKALGPDRLADPRTLVVQPGGPDGDPLRYDLIEVASGTRFIGIMALLPNPKSGEQDERRAVIPLAELDDRVIELSGYRLTLKDR